MKVLEHPYPIQGFEVVISLNISYEQALSAYTPGELIESIKCLRTRFPGLGLRDAKEIIEYVRGHEGS